MSSPRRVVMTLFCVIALLLLAELCRGLAAGV